MGKIKIKDYSILRVYKIPWIFDDNMEKINENYFNLEHLFQSELFRKNPDFNLEIAQHLKSLYKYALKVSGEIYDPEELLHDTIIRAFRFYHKYNKQIEFLPWLKMIMRNCFINRYRKLKQIAFQDIQDLETFNKNIISNLINPRLGENKEFLTLLDLEIIKALSTFQNEFKSVIILKYIEGFNESEISLLMDYTVDEVKGIILVGRNYLQGKLIHFDKYYKFAKVIKLNTLRNSKLIQKSASI